MENTISNNVEQHTKEIKKNHLTSKQHTFTSKNIHNIMELTSKMEQGKIQALFPNLGMEIISNGCVCKIIQVSSQQVKVEITEAINPMYKVGNQIWVDSFLIPSDEEN